MLFVQLWITKATSIISLFRHSYLRSFSTTVLMTAVTISLTLRNLHRVGLLIEPVLLCLEIKSFYMVFVHKLFYRVFNRNISYCDEWWLYGRRLPDPWPRSARLFLPLQTSHFTVGNLIALQQFVVKKIKRSEWRTIGSTEPTHNIDQVVFSVDKQALQPSWQH